MAYFPNGTEHMDWASWNCDKCVNDDPDKLCKVMELHLTLDHNKEEDRVILDTLIPMSPVDADEKPYFAEQCTMFKEANPFFHEWDGIGTRFRNEISDTHGR